MEVSEIIERVDMTEYISQYVDLEQKGRELWGFSPFKEEKTPSFSVDPEKKYFYDFSAGVGGNLIDFVTRYNNVSVRQAVNMLKQYAHITEDESGEIVTRLEATRIAKRYRSQVKKLPKMTAKPLPENCMDRFEFNRKKLSLWADEGIDWDVMRQFGVRYDGFDDRIVYPIRDYNGSIVSICGRTCDPDYKAKGIRKYTYQQAIGTLDTIYAAFENKEAILSSKEIILFEGAKSVMKAYGWGVRNTAALLTSHLSKLQFNYLIKLSCFYGVRVVFALDSDIDITKDDTIKHLLLYARVEWIKNRDNMLEEKDSPTDQGEEVFKKLYAMRERLN